MTAITLWNLAGQLTTILWCAGLAAFLAIGLYPLVRRWERWGLPRPLAITTVSVSSLVAVCGVLFMILPPLVEQASALVAHADDVAGTGRLDPVAAHLQQFVPISMLDVRALLDASLEGLTSGMTMQSVSSDIMNTGSVLGNGVFVTTIVGQTVAMPNVMILLVTLVGGTLYGILGALLSVPIAVAVAVSVAVSVAHGELTRARRARGPRVSAPVTVDKHGLSVHLPR